MPDIVDAGSVYNRKILARTGVLPGGLPGQGVKANAVGTLMKQGAWKTWRSIHRLAAGHGTVVA